MVIIFRSYFSIHTQMLKSYLYPPPINTGCGFIVTHRYSKLKKQCQLIGTAPTTAKQSDFLLFPFSGYIVNKCPFRGLVCSLR